MKTGVSKKPVGFLRAIMSLVISSAALAATQETSVPKPPQTTEPTDLSGVEETAQQRGPFAISEQNYTVVLHIKRLAAATTQLFGQTLAGLEVRDAAGNVAYQKSFPSVAAGGGFQQSVSASTQRLSGKTGAGLAVHYVEQTQSIQPTRSQTKEFWQLFGLINGKLAPLPKPAMLGEASGGGPFMGVMMRAANGAVPMISQPDIISVRVWAGSFYAIVPLRVNWGQGGLVQGQRCIEMFFGGHEVGCENARRGR